MAILLWIIFGAIVGWIASIITNTDAEQGAVLNIIVGVIGVMLGGWIMSFLGESPVTGFNLYSFVVAIISAVVLVSLLKLVR